MSPRKNRNFVAAARASTSGGSTATSDSLSGFAAKRLATSALVGIVAFVAAVWLIARPSLSSLSPSPSLVRLYSSTSPPVTQLAMFQDPQHSAKYLWGTYRPQLYFGMRTRLPKSLVTGLLWYDPHNPDAFAHIRHTCEQGDGLTKYGWLKHDGASYGKQELHDDDLLISTEFVKDTSSPSPASRPSTVHGGNWVVRLTARQAKRLPESSRPASSQRFAVLLFYLAFEPGLAIDANSMSVQEHTKDTLRVAGLSESLGEFSFEALHRNSTQSEFHWVASHVAHVHNMTDQARAFIREQIRTRKVTSLPDEQKSARSNMVLLQMVAELPFQADLIFRQSPRPAAAAPAAAAPAPVHLNEHSEHSDALDPFSSAAAIASALKEGERAFDDKFERIFQLKSRGFNASMVAFAKAAQSNLLGGIGYFHGRAKVTSGLPHDPVLNTEPLTLFTAVPSRPFFPRGFMWDEGFHQLLIQQWDQALTRDILAHWFDLMNVDGWIPREVILGIEAESKVPAEFIVQRATNANPPTFLIALERMLGQSSSAADTNANRAFLIRLYPRLETWFQWFTSSQAGAEKSTFRWRGRDAATDRELNPKTLTSGLDDYPRASHPSDDEKHVDLYSWMSLAARIMYNISRLVEDDELQAPAPAAGGRGGSAHYLELIDQLSAENLKAHHWNSATHSFCDYGNHTDGVKLSWHTPPIHIEKNHAVNPTPYLRRTLTHPKSAPPKPQFVNQFGYVSLFPLLLNLLDANDPLLPEILDSIADEGRLWTPYGLRSLSKGSPIYLKHNTEHDGPYWRGPVWINMNYLAVGALHRVAEHSSDAGVAARARKLHDELRGNIVGNMFSEYKRTGYIWEQYDVAPSNEGRGKGSHPFTGWSSLVLLMMAELY